MTKMHLMAKLTLTILGIFVLVEFLNNLNIGASMSFRRGLSEVTATGIIALLIASAVPCVLAYHLLFNSDRWATKIVGSTSENVGALNRLWIVSGFRLPLFLCGLLIISGSTQFIIDTLHFVICMPALILDLVVFKIPNEIFYMPFYRWVQILIKICKAVLGIYLILGAPQFVRWHVRKFESYLTTQVAKTQTQ